VVIEGGHVLVFVDADEQGAIEGEGAFHAVGEELVGVGEVADDLEDGPFVGDGAGAEVVFGKAGDGGEEVDGALGVGGEEVCGVDGDALGFVGVEHVGDGIGTVRWGHGILADGGV